MSFTLLSHPGDYYSAHGDVIYVVYDDTRPADPDYTNYKYILDVFVNGSTDAVASISKAPQPGSYFGIFNIGDIVRNYVASVFNPAVNVIRCQESGSGEFFVTVVCKFYVSFLFGGDFTYDPNDGSYLLTDTRVLFNHYNSRMPGAFTLLSSFANKLATYRPAQNYINTGDAYNFIPYYPTSTSGVAIQVKAYAGATLQGTYNGTITPSAANNMQMLNVAPAAINAASAGLINAVTTHYTVQVNSGIIYTFKFTCEAIYSSYALHFLNKLGGFESRNFSKVSRKTIQITKTDFGKLPYQVDASGNVYYWNANNVYNETRSTFASEYKEKMVLNTDNLTDAEYAWLDELVLSPLVFIELGGYFVPCVITATDYEYRKIVNDKLTNLTVTIEFGDQFNAQYR